MKIWKGLVWPFLSKVAKYIWSMVEANAQEMVKKIPQEILSPVIEKIKEVSVMDLTGPEKMAIVREYALMLLGDKVKFIGKSLVDTFIQNVYQDLQNRGIIK